MRLIGEARYGVLAIAWLLLGYFGLFDLGLGRATAQRIAAQRDATTGDRARTFWTALTLNAGLGFVGGLLIWPIANYFFGNVFKVEEILHHEVQAAVPWLILAVPMATISGVLSGALQGRERFIWYSTFSTIAPCYCSFVGYQSVHSFACFSIRSVDHTAHTVHTLPETCFSPAFTIF